MASLAPSVCEKRNQIRKALGHNRGNSLTLVPAIDTKIVIIDKVECCRLTTSKHYELFDRSFVSFMTCSAA
jgi:hypothetical protein